MKKDVFDAICYIPKFEQWWDNVITKKISYEIAFFLWMDQITTPYKPKMNDSITIPMADKQTLFGSTVEYDLQSAWWWTYTYQSPKWLVMRSAQSKQRWLLAEFINHVNEYLFELFSDSDREAAIQRWKQIFEITLRCGLKKRKHIDSISQSYVIQDNGYLMNPKTKQYLLSLDNFVVDSDNLEISAIKSMTCAEYVARELRHSFDLDVMDECDQFLAYTWDNLLNQWIEQLAIHAIEIFELQKPELALWFANGYLKDEYMPVRN